MDAHLFAQYVSSLLPSGENTRPFSWAAEQVALLLAAHPDGVTDAIVRCHLHRILVVDPSDPRVRDTHVFLYAVAVARLRWPVEEAWR